MGELARGGEGGGERSARGIFSHELSGGTGPLSRGRGQAEILGNSQLGTVRPRVGWRPRAESSRICQAQGTLHPLPSIPRPYPMDSWLFWDFKGHAPRAGEVRSCKSWALRILEGSKWQKLG